MQGGLWLTPVLGHYAVSQVLLACSRSSTVEWQWLTPMLLVMLYAAAGALAALQSKRDGIHRRCEGLLKCKNEFAELARAL